MNKKCLTQALSIIGDRRNKEAAEKKAKEKELLKVFIKKEDVDLIVSTPRVVYPTARVCQTS